MLTSAQFQTLMTTVREVLTDIVKSHSSYAAVVLGIALTAFDHYEPGLIATLQQKGIIKR
jgi:hypothetical protein